MNLSRDPSGKGRTDYLVLVNKQHPLPEGWEERLETVHTVNSAGEEVEVEKKTYEAFLHLAAALERQEGIHIELDSGRRSISAQQEIRDRFLQKYGEEYTRRYVAEPGYSEHHTGLAVDLYFIADHVTVYTNEDLMKAEYLPVWKEIHARLADSGFILRYPEGREAMTGYDYEPWHLRYIDSPEIARLIMSKGITLEEYKAGLSP